MVEDFVLSFKTGCILFLGGTIIKIFTEEEAHKMVGGVVNFINLILETSISTVRFEENMPDRYYGSHILSLNAIFLNKTYFYPILKCEKESDHLVDFTFLASIIAHEIRHAYQESLHNPHYDEEFLKEATIFERIKAGLPFNEHVYANLDIEIDAHAFQALIEEKYFERYNESHFPIPSYMDVDAFNKRYAELKSIYKEKIDKAYATIYSNKKN